MSWAEMKRGQKIAREAQANIDNFEYQQDLDALQISDEAEQLAMEQIGQNEVNALDMLRGAGSRAVIGGVGRIVAGTNQAARESVAALDKKQTDLDMMVAGMKERRDNQELMGYGSLLNYGLSRERSGMVGLSNSFSGMAPFVTAFDQGSETEKTV